MRTQHRLPLAGRNPESGVIAFVVAAMWMVLFGLAAFAVDIGYRYQSKFGIQAAADSAVRAGMPSFVSGNTPAATSAALAMALANGYPSGQVNVTPSGNLFQVDITATPPSFFLGLFGSPTSFPLGATAIGEKTGGGGGPLLFANDACGSGLYGIRFNGGVGAPFNLNGNIQSNGDIYDGANVVNFLGGATGQSPCAGEPVGWNAPAIAPSISLGGPFPDPFAGTTIAGMVAALGGCQFGTDLVSAWNPPNANWTYDGSTVPPHGKLTPGVYCSGGNMTVADITGAMFNDVAGSTFIVMGALQLGSNNGGVYSPYPGSPHNIFAIAWGNGSSIAGGPALNLGTSGDYNVTGAAYAPNGWLNWGGGSVTMANGALVANEINLSSSPGFIWNLGGGGGGGGGGTTWKMHR